jgi:thiol:disulfide interchange protein DsbD
VAANAALPALLAAGELCAQTSAAGPVRVTLVSEAKVAEAGKSFTVALRMDHEPSWHTYWLNPGTGQPTTVQWQLPDGWTAGPLIWSLPEVEKGPLGCSHLYTGMVYHLTEITPTAAFAAGSKEKLKAKVSWLQCDPSGCTQRQAALELTMTAGTANQFDPALKEAFDKVREEQPRSTPAWEVQTIRSSSRPQLLIVLKPKDGANPDPGEIYFFDRNAVTKCEPPVVGKGAAGLNLTFELEDDTGDKQPDGFLAASNGWLAGGKMPAMTVKVEGTPPATAGTPGTPSTATQPAVVTPPGTTAPASDTSTISAETLAALDAIIPSRGPKYVTLDGQARKPLTYWWAMLLAFMGGFILNAMPCVFPVLGIKVLGFVGQAGDDPRKIRRHGIVFTLGLLVSLWVLAGILIALNFGGQRFGWGFQQQSPGFTIFIVGLLFVLGLNLAGVFEIGTSLTSVGGGLMGKEGYSGSFFTGVLTTLIATPCSGPFLGTAMGYTLQQPPFPALLLFTSFGLGIALPYLVLSLQPKLINRLPRPGAWMETFKMLMAFPMFATAIYFLNAFAGQVGTAGLIDALIALLLLAVAGWVYGHWVTFVRPKRQQFIAAVTAAGLAGLGVWQAAAATRNESESATYKKQLEALNDDFAKLIGRNGKIDPIAGGNGAAGGDFKWEKWSPERVRDLRREGRILFADFTAKW